MSNSKNYSIGVTMLEQFNATLDKNLIINFCKLSDNSKPKNYRKRSVEEIYKHELKFANFIKKILEKYVGAKLVSKVHSGKTGVDSDVIYTFSNGVVVNVELKFGKPGNCTGDGVFCEGMKLGIKHFDVSRDTKNNVVIDILSDDINYSKWLDMRDNHTNEMIDYFNKNFADKPLTDEQYNFVFNNLIGNTGKKNRKTENVFIFRVKDFGKFEQIEVYKPVGTYRFKRMEYVDVNKETGNITAKITITNGKDTIDFSQHWKNNYHIPKDYSILTGNETVTKLPANLGFSSMCWDIHSFKNYNRVVKKDKIIDLYILGKTVEMIAKIVKCTVNYVMNVIRNFLNGGFVYNPTKC